MLKTECQLRIQWVSYGRLAIMTIMVYLKHADRRHSTKKTFYFIENIENKLPNLI